MTERDRIRPPPHLCDHLASRCRQDHADRKAPPLRRRDPARRRGSRQGDAAADPLRLDGDRAPARHLGGHLGDDVRICRQGLQPPRHARPRGLLRGHLPDPLGGRFRGHGDRRGEGHRGAHEEALRGLPASRHPDHHLHQQDGPRGARPVRPPRGDREDARPRHRAALLAARLGPELRRRLRPRGRHRPPHGRVQSGTDPDRRRSRRRALPPGSARPNARRPPRKSHSPRRRAGRSTSPRSARVT